MSYCGHTRVEGHDTYHGLHAEHVTVVTLAAVVLGDVCEVRQVVGVLARTVDVAYVVLAHQLLRTEPSEPSETAIRGWLHDTDSFCQKCNPVFFSMPANDPFVVTAPLLPLSDCYNDPVVVSIPFLNDFNTVTIPLLSLVH